jgi:hypothetical protein
MITPYKKMMKFRLNEAVIAAGVTGEKQQEVSQCGKNQIIV